MILLKTFFIFTIFFISNVEVFSANNFSINIQVGNKIFKGTLVNNPSTRALIKKFPLKIVMSDLYNNEKYYHFSETFPTNQEQVENIKIGDIFLYRSNYLVIFYDNFKTSYSYTKLGQVNDISGFKEALGKRTIETIWSFDAPTTKIRDFTEVIVNKKPGIF
ncbi:MULTISPECIES: cyclophilin-like fold protein [Cetobacterium]|uniref:Cyclophilin-like fold protein n=1 Tax=Candidatus Cetobacterium colombiensis TaxID=3073100 RepID=A0ABU4WBN0_9FUSO|nr:cyclophilin-like fold protein [Candidatus Cetobacterium colombiensis]MDX8336947.1 cyclophilin-like fold protein [Candidatus Cetobacterium colombiensis]